MIMAVAAAVQLAGTDAAGAREAVAALVFYLAVYVFMNLGAFAIVAFLRNAIGSEEIADYAGLIRRARSRPSRSTAILVSLIGMPPLAGFIGKFAIFASLVDAGGPWMIGLLVIAGINTAISLIYYLRVAKSVCIDPRAGRPRPGLDRPAAGGVRAGRRAAGAASTASCPARMLEVARQATQAIIDVMCRWVEFYETHHQLDSWWVSRSSTHSPFRPPISSPCPRPTPSTC